MRNFNSTKFLASLTGLDLGVGDKLASNQEKILAVLGSTILIPAMLAVISWGFALNFIFGNMYIAIAGGFFAGFVVFLIDRSIIAIGNPNKKFTASMVARLLIGVTIGFLIAEPLILVIAEDVIDENRNAVIMEKTKVIDTQYDELIAAKKESLEPGRTRLNELQQAYTEEMDGTGGSGIRNQGPIYQKKYSDYLSEKEAYKKEVERVNADVEVLIKDRDAKIAALKDTEATGLFGRIQDLHAPGKHSWNIRFAVWLLRLFFLAVEMIPFIAKIAAWDQLRPFFKEMDRENKQIEADIELTAEQQAKVAKLISENETKYRLQVEKNKSEDLLTREKIKHEILLANNKQRRFELKMEKIKMVTDSMMASQELEDSKIKEANEKFGWGSPAANNIINFVKQGVKELNDEIHEIA